MKKLLFILLSIPLLFSSCQTCKECEPDEVEQTIIGYETVYVGTAPGEWMGTDQWGDDIWGPSTDIYEEQPIYSSAIMINLEVCRDNFQSKDDYESYISEKENQGYTCRSDFWN